MSPGSDNVATRHVLEHIDTGRKIARVSVWGVRSEQPHVPAELSMSLEQYVQAFVGPERADKQDEVTGGQEAGPETLLGGAPTRRSGTNEGTTAISGHGMPSARAIVSATAVLLATQRSTCP